MFSRFSSRNTYLISSRWTLCHIHQNIGMGLPPPPFLLAMPGFWKRLVHQPINLTPWFSLTNSGSARLLRLWFLTLSVGVGLQYPFAHLAWFLLSSGKGKHNQFKFGFVVDKCTFRKQIWAVKVDIFKFEEDIKCEMVMLILMLMSMMATRLKANNLFSTENWKGY